MDEIVVMFCGPHYGGQVDCGRIDRAVSLALARQCPLLICGDARDGWECVAFGCRAVNAGVPVVWVRHNGKANTLGDAISAAGVVSMHKPHVDRIHLVTDWYHIPRAFVQLWKKKNRRSIRAWIIPAPVWGRWDERGRLPDELKGALHALISIPQSPKGQRMSKRKTARELFSRSRRIFRRLRATRPPET